MKIERANTGIVEWGYLVDDEGRTVAQGSVSMLERIRAGKPAVNGREDDGDQPR